MIEALVLAETEYHVGDGWRYQCKSCGHKVGIDRAFPKTCPGCGAGGWWGHLVTTGNNGKVAQQNGDGDDIKNSEVTMPGGIKTHNRILSQLPDAAGHGVAQNNGVSDGRGRGRPLQSVPDDLILKLASQGFSSRAMAARLNEQGIIVSYKTIQRRLQGSLL